MEKINKIIKDFNIPIKEIIIENNLLSKSKKLINNLEIETNNILLVADQNTCQFSKKISTEIKCTELILQNPKADNNHVKHIIKKGKNYDLIIAVGSGTINDISKLASSKLKIPYIIFGTAPSMNGYASANASITINSHKTSISAHLPTAIYLDLDILENSPERLIKSGIGDSLCFSTCKFDWLLSNLLLDTYYDSTPFDLLFPYYEKLINFKFNKINTKFIKILSQTLIISGLGMYITKGSYPASQGEHLIAHYIAIKYPEIANKSYHGEQIAVTTLTMVEIQEIILQKDNIELLSNKITKEDLAKIFDTDLIEHFFNEIKNKFIDIDKLNYKLKNHWPQIRQKLSECLITKNKLLELYQKFMIPKSNNDINIEDDIYKESVNYSYLIRNRFTALDLIKMTNK